MLENFETVNVYIRLLHVVLLHHYNVTVTMLLFILSVDITVLYKFKTNGISTLVQCMI